MPAPSPPSRSERPVKRGMLTPRGVLLIVVLIAMLFSSVYPLGRYLSARGEIDTLEAEEVALLERIEDLEAERDRLNDPTVIEELARERLLYVRPGEVPFAIVGEPLPEDVPPRIVPTTEVDPDDGLFDRWWDALRRVTTGRY